MISPLMFAFGCGIICGVALFAGFLVLVGDIKLPKRKKKEHPSNFYSSETKARPFEYGNPNLPQMRNPPHPPPIRIINE